VLLADEPTGNLDTATGEVILKLIRDLSEKLGSTILIVTHDTTVAESCERTIRIRDGRVVSDVLREVSLR
jgi:putative ABC transport system ATP-binding protein